MWNWMCCGILGQWWLWLILILSLPPAVKMNLTKTQVLKRSRYGQRMWKSSGIDGENNFKTEEVVLINEGKLPKHLRKLAEM